MSGWVATFYADGGGLGLLTFACLAGAALLSLYGHPRLSPRSRSADTHEVVKLATSMIVVMTSVVLGLLASAMSTSFSGVARDVDRFSTSLILTDRALRQYGPQAEPVRALLLRYTERALSGTWPSPGRAVVVDDAGAGALLDRTEMALLLLQPSTPAQASLAKHAEERLRSVLDQRWTLIGEAHSQLPAALIVVLIVWLALAFASLGYNAPRNRVVVTTLLLSAASMAAAMFLIVELDGPFDGLLRVSSAPLQHALETMRAPAAAPLP